MKTWINLFAVVIAALFASVAFAEESATTKVVAALPWEDILPLIGSAVAALVMWLVGLLTKWIQSKIKHDGIRQLVGRLDDAAARAVRSVEQSVRPKLVAALEDGKLTSKEKAELRQAAIDGVKASINLPDAVKIFGSAADAEKHIETAVEAAVHDLRTANPQ